jgi:hypothetical protein
MLANAGFAISGSTSVPRNKSSSEGSQAGLCLLCAWLVLTTAPVPRGRRRLMHVRFVKRRVKIPPDVIDLERYELPRLRRVAAAASKSAIGSLRAA